MAMTQQQPDTDLGGVFAALADSTRRQILTRLTEGPATVSELAAPFDMSLPAVSRHLKVLERAGLMKRSIDGRVHHCSAVAEPLADAADWLRSRHQFWDRKLRDLADYLEETDDE